ncbi:hypothetical protein B0H10DRAFT_2021566, partial [Mycena sp. CBHHK59/15]
NQERHMVEMIFDSCWGSTRRRRTFSSLWLAQLHEMVFTLNIHNYHTSTAIEHFRILS